MFGKRLSADSRLFVCLLTAPPTKKSALAPRAHGLKHIRCLGCHSRRQCNLLCQKETPLSLRFCGLESRHVLVETSVA